MAIGERFDYLLRCEKCHEDTSFIIMAGNVNPGMDPDDIHRIQENKAKNPYSLNWCENCNMYTLFKYMGYEITPLDIFEEKICR